MSAWVYIQSEPGLFTVGHYDPAGHWHPDSDHTSQRAAGERCAWLNGSPKPEQAEDLSLAELAAQAEEVRRHASEEMAAIIMNLSKSAALETNMSERCIYWTIYGWVVEDVTAEDLWHCGPHLEQALCRLLAIGEEEPPVSHQDNVDALVYGIAHMDRIRQSNPDAPTPAEIDAQRHAAELLKYDPEPEPPTLDDLAQQAATACAEALRAIVAWRERAVPNLAEVLADLADQEPSESQEEET